MSASPLKPWEQSQRSAPSSSAPSSWPSVSSSPPPSIAPPRSASSIHIRGQTNSSPSSPSSQVNSTLPPVPNRPRTIPTSPYGSSHSSSYGSPYRREMGYGSYGMSRYGSYGGIGSNYGGYGSYGMSRYGNYGGYGGYGSYSGRYDDFRSGPFGMREKHGEIGYTWIQDLQYFADGFARFSQLLDANCDAMYTSLSSVLRLLENFTLLRQEIFYIFKALAFIGALRKLWSWAMGNSNNNLHDNNHTSAGADISPSSFKEFQNNTQLTSNSPSINQNGGGGRSSLWPLRLFALLAIILGGPVLLARLIKFFSSASRRKQNNIEGQDEWETTQLEDKVRALYDFRATNQDEIEFKKGDVLLVLHQPIEEWFEAENRDGVRGLIPANYVEPMIPIRSQR